MKERTKETGSLLWNCGYRHGVSTILSPKQDWHKDKINGYDNVNGGSFKESHEELRAINDCWEGDNLSSTGMKSLIGYLILRDQYEKHTVICSTKWTQFIIMYLVVYVCA